ncbi:complex I subunit 5 family protein [Tranquillimonas alkanivorans]|uniref:Multicomponent Na+:H+ antiporter subunit D n=1 Tax=Tranquillimonas alkanivorans TaxID=441119 RepID=A0A1I5Q1D3_9RHOB|nr:proton-conducting transporter membrane subunit [Tranquillimonas alkanivorans]SFP39676.1 multicomponent Na+:H+ antiporter subunit D [Tranquillimonas alkanivorans]
MTPFLPALILGSALVPGIITFFLPEERVRLRNALNLGGALVKLGLVVFLVAEVNRGRIYETSFDLVPGLPMVLRLDALGLLFVTLSTVLWLLTTVYAIGYFGRRRNLSRFFGFFSLCVFSTTGIAFSGTLVTLFFFYELLTLATWPLVVHWGDAASIRAGRRYLVYTMSGSAVLLFAIVWLESTVGPVEFTVPAEMAAMQDWTARGILVLLVAGLGVKAALVGLHRWLPAAMVAPAPVSALLHAVAVVKAGAFGIVRIVYDVYGIELVHELSMTLPLALAASATILFGSLMALGQRQLKPLLAYSTVSQVSYILLGAALFSPYATIGGLVHLVHQGLMKITLFFCAGVFDERAGIHDIDELDGIGARMPWTSVAFTIGALGMIGLPPIAGFVSKWYLGLGGVGAGHEWVVAVLAASSLLNCAYFLPVLTRIWFRAPGPHAAAAKREVPAALVVPPAITAAAALAAGLFAAFAYSPLGWATLIVGREYTP